jgi:membrane protein implicated in regulation of membrane protease activity
MIISVLLVIFGFLSIKYIISFFTTSESLLDKIKKSIFTSSIFSGLLVVLILLSREKNDTIGNNQDSNIISWCMDKNNDIKGSIYPISISIVLIILSIISVVSLLLHRKCVF